MPYPAGMQTFQKRFGPAYAQVGGEQLRMLVRVTPSTSVVWAATMTPLVAYCQQLEAAPGLQGVIVLPSPDQDGFIDSRGDTVRGWTYDAKIDYLDSGGEQRGTARTTFTYTAGAPDPSDLENVVPLPASDGTRIAVTVPVRAALDGDELVLYDLTGEEMFRGDVRGPAGPGTYDGGVDY